LTGFPLKGAVFLGYCGGLAEGPSGPVLSSSPTGWMALKAQFARAENFWKKRRNSFPKPIWGRFSPIPAPKKGSGAKESRGGRAKALGRGYGSEFRGFELSRRKIPFLVAKIVLDSWEEEVSLGLGRFLWAPRALGCSWKLGKLAPKLRQALEESGD
jgi:hypothetical protein